MTTTNRKIQLVSDLSGNIKTKAKKLLEAIKFISAEKKELEGHEKICKEELMDFMQKLKIDSLSDEDIGMATIKVTIRSSIKEEKLTGALVNAGVSARKIQQILRESKEETTSKPYISFTSSKKEVRK